MKRKLDEHDVPVPVSTGNGRPRSVPSFQDLGLDSRILQAIAREGFISPTPVQAEVIPLALGGKDIFGESLKASLYVTAYCLQLGRKQALAKRLHTCYLSWKLLYVEMRYEFTVEEPCSRLIVMNSFIPNQKPQPPSSSFLPASWQTKFRK